MFLYVLFIKVNFIQFFCSYLNHMYVIYLYKIKYSLILTVLIILNLVAIIIFIIIILIINIMLTLSSKLHPYSIFKILYTIISSLAFDFNISLKIERLETYVY